MKARPLDGQDRRRGVALIIVLGFLSVMILMAVAFLTQARVERLVSASSLEGMRSRQMAQTAIAAAMQDYLNALKEVSPADKRHDVFLSGDGKSTLQYYYSGILMDDTRLLIGKVEDWLLDNHLEAGLADGEDGVKNAEWVWVRERPGTRSRILGRYAYACFDMSGLLDANVLGTDPKLADIGEGSPYWYGGDPTNRNNVRKMLLDAAAMTPKAGRDRQEKLNRLQNAWKGFDTPAALLNLTDGKVNDGDDNASVNRWAGVEIDEAAVGGIDPSALAAYSYSVLHREDGSGKRKIECTALEIQNDSDFSAILSGADRANVVKALGDYESTSAYPQGVDYPSVKNVPMFNEIGVQVELIPGGAYGYQMQVRLKVEFWYPFPSKDNETSASFAMTAPTLGGSTTAAGGADIWVQFAGSIGGVLTPLALGTVNPNPAGGLTVEAKFNDNKPYYAQNAASGDLIYTADLSDPANPGVALPPGLTLTVRNVQIKGPFTLRLGGQAVDAMPSAPVDFSFRAVPALALGTATPWMSQGVEDPRFNHLSSSWLREDTPSFGEINAAAKAAQNAARTRSGIAPGNYLYCRNGTIRCPAELGYLPAGRAWETLDVFSEPGIRLMNRLVDADTIDYLETHAAYFTNGMINPYTRSTNVLNAAFYGIDAREVPNMDGKPKATERLSGNNLEQIVRVMMEEPNKNGPAGWSRIFTSRNLPEELNKNRRVATTLGNWGLFSESDRLFVVAVASQSIKEGSGAAGLGNWNADEDMITGERRAVALCWMDGSADVGGETLAQEMNIIMFQYLNE